MESVIAFNEKNHSTSSNSNFAQKSSKFCCLGSSLQVSFVDQFYPQFALSAMLTSNDVDAHIQDGLKKVAFSENSASFVDCLIADTRDW